jgi:hypothetical protein
VKIKTVTGAVAAAAMALSFGAAVPASATDNIQPFGTQETLNDFGTGGPMIGYTVMGLTPSSDAVPHNGQLYEAPVTVNAFGAWATPMISMFNARAESSALYQALPASGAGGPVPPGGSSTGKLYFDVVGDAPNSVVYNDGVRDLLAWVGTSRTVAPGGAPASGGSSSSLNGGAETGGGNAPGGPTGPMGSAGDAGGGDQGVTGSDAGGGGFGGASGAGGGAGGAGG